MTDFFTFDDTVSVMDKMDLYNYFQAYQNGKWYEPPISFDSLSKGFRANPHHASAIYVKRNIISGTYIPHPLLNRKAFDAIVLDFLVFGNAYIEVRRNRLGEVIQLIPSLAKYTRRGIEAGKYYFVDVAIIDGCHEFKKNSIIHLIDSDINQEIYGLPEYLSAMQAALLNENATIFRRRYYKNGSHAGYIMYLTDPQTDTRDIDALREAVRSSKGIGNFKNLFMYAPNGKPEGLKIIPLSEVAAKDEFLNIKNVTRDDVLAAHRVPPQLMGIIPNNTGGFGSISDAAKVFNVNEIKPLQSKLLAINDWLDQEIVRFKEYDLSESAQKT